MTIEEVLGKLDTTIHTEEYEEHTKAEAVKILEETSYLIKRQVKNNTVVCKNCGENLKECVCSCSRCDNCSACTCANSSEDFLLSDNEIGDIVSDILKLTINKS